MNDKLADALEHISDAHISEAAAAKKSRKRLILRAIAAVVALVILISLPGLPMAIPAQAVAEASGSRQPERPDIDRYKDREAYRADYDVWSAQRDQRSAYVDAALQNLAPFFAESTALYIGDSEENRVWSPVNGYIALAMLAEVTGGESREQILTALNTPSLEVLRNHVGAIWEEVYREGNEACTLANSLWLNEDLSYNRDAMDALAYYHYASVYQADLSSPRAGRALRAWLNNNTGGLLKDYTARSAFPSEAVLTLASTVYLQAKWSNEFNPTRNTVDTFHAPGGDITVTYMNKKETQMNYYWGSSFGAVSLGLKNGCAMWLILPDEGKSLSDVLAEGEYLVPIDPENRVEGENYKYMKVNLSVPKFDISSGGDIRDMLVELGITDVFHEGTADFSAITSDSPVYVTAVNQAARVIIDEQGVKAASYIEIPGAGAAMPPEEIIDFILDRPFLFIIADSGGIPLFIGAVNNP